MLDYEYRALCPCGQRHVTKTIEGESVCCPKCRMISPAVAEPCDELWWAWREAPEYVREIAPVVAKPKAKTREPRKIEGVPL